MSRFFIDRPIVAIVISIITVVLGVVAMAGLPTAQFPSIIPPQIQIQTTYTGADAVTIEQSVATPLEQQMNGVDKMLYMASTNANDGTMTLVVTFDVESEVNIDQVNAQNRVSQAQPNLPTDVNQYGLTYRSTVGLPLVVFAVYSPKGTYDSLFLGNYAVVPAGQTIPGFDVSVWHGIVAPARMEPALVARINGIFNQILEVPAVRRTIAELQAAEIIGGTPQQFDAFIKSELKRWPEVVRTAGIQAAN